jgi:PAS domain-containing protein
METVLANMSDGVTLFDKDFNWVFSNRHHIERQEYPPDLLKSGTTGYDMIRYQIGRGEFGPVDDIERKVQEHAAMMRQAGGTRYERRTKTGRYIEFNLTPLDDGGLLGVYRDITELKDREVALAAAKEAADASRAETERTKQTLQTVLDNMNDGVLLLDRDFRVRFTNGQYLESLRLPPHLVQEGVPCEDIIAFQAKRGDFGPVDDVNALVRERRDMMLTPGGVRYDRLTVSGRHIEFNYKPLEDGGLLGVHRNITELKEREQRLERAQQVTQIVLDNMTGGFMLFDKDFRLQLVNRGLIELQRYPAELLKPGMSGYDIMRFQVERGDFGPVDDVYESFY